MLQAYVDESGFGPGQGAYVIGGFIASAEAWAAFSEEWKRALDGPPKLDYFKMGRGYGPPAKEAVQRVGRRAAR